MKRDGAAIRAWMLDDIRRSPDRWWQLWSPGAPPLFSIARWLKSVGFSVAIIEDGLVVDSASEAPRA